MSNASNKKLSTTTIQGVPPKWDDAEFHRRLHIRTHAYNHTRECTELITHPLEHEWLKLVAEKVNDGYTIDRVWPIHHGQLTNTIFLIKPEAVQVEEREALKEAVKAEYVDYLQSQVDYYKTKLAKQLIEAMEEKEQQALEKAKAKRLADAEKEADECFGTLVIPDGFPDKKPAIFTTDME